MLLHQRVALCGGEAGVGEHANLVRHVAPVPLRPRRAELCDEQRAHVADAPRHRRALLVVLGAQRRVGEHLVDEQRAVDGRRGVHRTDQQFELRLDARRLGRVGAHQRERAHSLAVEPKVLRERLREGERVARLGEEEERRRIPPRVPGREALVRHVDEDVVAGRKQCVGDALPVGGGGVDAGRVVRARVEHKDRAGRRLPDVLQHTLHVEPAVGAKVAVLAHLEARSLKDGDVVGPGGLRHVGGGARREKARVKVRRQTARTGARQRLDRRNAALAQCRAAGPVRKLERAVQEGGHADDARVLLVLPARDQPLLGLADRRQHPWRPAAVAVCADDEVDLVRPLVALEGLCDAEDLVGCTLRHLREVRAQNHARGGGVEEQRR
mmetsp:Transcript_4369/g.14360  ORF Transcript_4369/g.14360 Transcript_4369/m.14360 type:complete len:383 (+) Transcript_4369:432-1580(+)